MPEWVNWVVPPLFGAIIGYFTNWLAIKMLFRPLAPKYFLGKQLPFTPGVIPSRRDELADRIGEVISTYLINDQELRRVLLEPRVHHELAVKLEQGWLHWVENEQDISQFVGLYSQTTLDEVLSSALRAGQRAILLKLDDPSTEEYIVSTLHGWILQLSLREISATEAKGVAILLCNAWRTWVSSEEQMERASFGLDRLIEGVLSQATTSDVTLRQILGEEAEGAIEQMVYTLEPKLGEFAERFVQQESLAEQLTESLQGWLRKQMLLGMLSAFVSQERVAGLVQRLLKETGDFFALPHNRSVFSQQILQWLRVKLDDPLSLWIERLGHDRCHAVFQSLKKRLMQELVSRECQDWVCDNIHLMLGNAATQNVSSLATTWNIELDSQHLAQQLWTVAKGYVQKEHVQQQAEAKIRHFVYLIAHRPLAADVHALAKAGTKDAQDMATKQSFVFGALAELILNAAASQAATLLQTVDITLMVCRRMKEFPLQEIEKIVLSIAGHELSTITNLGGLLGALIGLLQLALSLIEMA